MGCCSSKGASATSGSSPRDDLGAGGEAELTVRLDATEPPRAVQQSTDGIVAAALKQKRRADVVIFGESAVDTELPTARRSVPKSDSARELILQALRDNVFFTEFGAAELADLVNAMEDKAVSAGTVVIKQGDPGDFFYVIEHGKFDIIVNDRKVADWGDGTRNRAFGELALLYNLPRAATVTATTDAQLWCIDRPTFRAIIARASRAQTARLRSALRRGILEDLSDAQLDALTAGATIVKYRAGDTIVRRGEEGDVFFIIESGSVICKGLPGEQSNNILTAGDYFGERALLRKEGRAADVEALTDTSLIALHREDFDSHLGHLRDLLEYNMGMRLLLCTPLIGALSEAARAEVFAALSVASYADGAVIAAQGRRCDSFFIVKDSAVVMRQLLVQPAGANAGAGAGAPPGTPRLGGAAGPSSLGSARDLSNLAGGSSGGSPAKSPAGGSFLARSLSRMNVLTGKEDQGSGSGSGSNLALAPAPSQGQGQGSLSVTVPASPSVRGQGGPGSRVSAADLPPGTPRSAGGSAADLSSVTASVPGGGAGAVNPGPNGGTVTVANDLLVLQPGHWFPDAELDSDAPLPVSFVARGETQVFVLEREAYLRLIAPTKARLQAEGRLRSVASAASLQSLINGRGRAGSSASPIAAAAAANGAAGASSSSRALLSAGSVSNMGTARQDSGERGAAGALPPLGPGAAGAAGAAGSGASGLPGSLRQSSGGALASLPTGSGAGAGGAAAGQQQRAPAASPSAAAGGSNAALGSSGSSGALAGLPVRGAGAGSAAAGSAGGSSGLPKDSPPPRPGSAAGSGAAAAGAGAPPTGAAPRRSVEGKEGDAASAGGVAMGGKRLSTEGKTGAGAMPTPAEAAAAAAGGASKPTARVVPAAAANAPAASRPKEARRFSTDAKPSAPTAAAAAAAAAGGAAAGGAGAGGSGGGASAAPLTLPPATRKRLGIPLRELELKKTLGTGTFGRVRLALHRRTNQVFALKMLQKAQIAALKQQKNIMAERDILWRVDHPFVIKLFDTYRDRDRLYMLLELVQGGELFGRLQNSPTPGRISPGEARFYAACVLDAFDYLHALHVVYRDLKPENLLIDAAGYLKLVDFGFAKFVPDRTFTLCGTPEYLAPELVLGRGHDKGVDYWAIGVLLFEQVAGYSPFADRERNDQMTICKNILRGVVDFPRHFSDRDLQNVILQLLVKDVSKRLGCMRGGAGDVKAHPFFRVVDWERLRRREVPPPWRPRIANALDTSNFDDYDETDKVAPYTGDQEWDAGF